MKKLHPEDYAKDIKKTLGYNRAIKVVTTILNDTGPESFKDLPRGVTFYGKDRQGQLKLKEEKKLISTHNWWINVYHILLRNMKND